MVYQGSKNRIAKDLLPIITKYLTKDRWYVEHFCGGCNMIDKVKHDKRIANDYNKYLIALFKALQDGVELPAYISKEEYDSVRQEKDAYPDWYVGFVGFVCSFRGIFFGSYVKTSFIQKGRDRNYQNEQISNFLKQKSNLNNVVFFNTTYNNIDIPDNSVIYADPPYLSTSDYKNESEFNHTEFLQWCREMTSKGHDVLISEYNAPNDFVCVWKKGINMNLSGGKGKTATEKLFVHESIADKYKQQQVEQLRMF